MKTIFISISKANPQELVAKYERWIKANEAKLKATQRSVNAMGWRLLKDKIDRQKRLLAAAKKELKKAVPAKRVETAPVAPVRMYTPPRKFYPNGSRRSLDPIGVNGRRR